MTPPPPLSAQWLNLEKAFGCITRLENEQALLDKQSEWNQNKWGWNQPAPLWRAMSDFSCLSGSRQHLPSCYTWTCFRWSGVNFWTCVIFIWNLQVPRQHLTGTKFPVTTKEQNIIFTYNISISLIQRALYLSPDWKMPVQGTQVTHRKYEDQWRSS